MHFSRRWPCLCCRQGKGNLVGLHTLLLFLTHLSSSIDTTTAKLQHTTKNAHDASINRIKWLTNSLLASGDDNGLVKVSSYSLPSPPFSFIPIQLWDPRQSHAIRSYDHHFDYITDFLWLQHANQLVTSSGDATLSVIDVRKSTPLAHSEDQEDELLSLVSIRGSVHPILHPSLHLISHQCHQSPRRNSERHTLRL